MSLFNFQDSFIQPKKKKHFGLTLMQSTKGAFQFSFRHTRMNIPKHFHSLEIGLGGISHAIVIYFTLSINYKSIKYTRYIKYTSPQFSPVKWVRECLLLYYCTMTFLITIQYTIIDNMKDQQDCSKCPENFHGKLIWRILEIMELE